MDEKRWQGLRESGFRIFFVGLFSLVIAFVIYSRLTVPSPDPPAVQAQQLTNLAYAVLAITAASMASMLYGAYTIFRSEQMRSAGSNSLISFITGAFANRSYWKIMAAAAIGYGVFFGFLSQIFVYRADVSFTEEGLKVQLCHRTGNGSYHLIEVSIDAEPAHRAHGDGKIGEPVPGNTGKVFGANCSVI